MRAGAVAESWLEKVFLSVDLAPRPLVESMLGLLLARVIMAGTRFGVFDLLEDGPRTTADVAAACRTDPDATAALLDALHGAGYVRQAPDGRWANTRASSRWLTTHAPESLRDDILFRYDEWDLIADAEVYCETGRPTGIHGRGAAHGGFWRRYQRAMRSIARLGADELAARVPVPPGATRVVDVAGGPGEFAIALCRRHPRLTAEVVELAPAAAVGRELVAAAGMTDRVAFRVADLRAGGFGDEVFDVALVVNLLHHLEPPDAARLFADVARALRPGGVVVVGDALREPGPRRPTQLESLLAFYFKVTSGGGLPTTADVHGWLAAAGLEATRPLPLRRAPGASVITARKPHPMPPP